MTTRDLASNIDVETSIAPDTRSTSVNGAGVDLQGFESAAIAFVVGAVDAATYTPTIEDSTDNASWGTVPGAQLSATLVDLATNTNQRVGYRGGKRYVRAVITVSGSPSAGAETSAVVIRGNAAQRPVA